MHSITDSERRAVIDLHCDLLLYLADRPDRTPEDPAPRCSLPQLQAGGVTLQVTAIYAPTGSAPSSLAEREVAWFQQLQNRLRIAKAPMTIVASIENASCFAMEDEPFPLAIERLERWHRATGGFLCASLTHHHENRFGGGNYSSIGLKEDGCRLLPELASRGIALDLAHTSDALAEEALAFIDREGLPLRVLDTHTGFRAVHNIPRNLPDDIAREIIRRGGLIGLGAPRAFLGGEDPANLARHVSHGLALNGQRALAFGADFFCTEDVSWESRQHPEYVKNFPWVPDFFPFWSDASGYPDALARIEQDGGFSTAVLDALAHGNAAGWLAGHHAAVKLGGFGNPMPDVGIP